MSTIVYQSSCTESYFSEPRTTLSLKLNNNNSSKPSCRSFISIEALSSTKNQKEESVYVHPLVKHSSFMLSERSLQMCTESLGSETGTYDIQNDVVFSPSEDRKPRQKVVQNDVVKFPPPLTTMTGSNPIQVKPYRENGRLVMEAVSLHTSQSCMQAERSDGRLKLTLVNDEDDYSDEEDDEDSFDGENINSKNSNNFEIIKDNFEVIKDNFVGKDDGVDEISEKEELEVWNGKKVEFGVKLEMGKLQRPSRCMERGQGNKRLINWEPFWVAT